MGKQQYSAEFKIEAVKVVERTGDQVTKIPAELGVKPTTLHGWIIKYKSSHEAPFPCSGHLKPEDEKLKR